MPQPEGPTSRQVLQVQSTLAGFEDAARDLGRLLHASGLDRGLRHDIELAFEEIAINIIRHGSPTGEILVGITIDPDEIVLTFEDDGVPFDPRTQPDPPAPRSIEEAEDGGFGLKLVRKIASRVDYERTPEDRNHLTLVIPVRSRAP